MIALVVGISLIVFALLSVVPFGFDWWVDVLRFLKARFPVMAVFIGYWLFLSGK
jgi:hypothetical protein